MVACEQRGMTGHISAEGKIIDLKLAGKSDLFTGGSRSIGKRRFVRLAAVRQFADVKGGTVDRLNLQPI